MLPGFARAPAPGDAHLPPLRAAMREEKRVVLGYVDAKGAATRRVIWPVALGFFEGARVVAAWCESREAFRHFRIDRMRAVEVSPDRYPRRRRILLAEWRKAEGVEIEVRKDADRS